MEQNLLEKLKFADTLKKVSIIYRKKAVHSHLQYSPNPRLENSVQTVIPYFLSEETNFAHPSPVIYDHEKSASEFLQVITIEHLRQRSRNKLQEGEDFHIIYS
jgi:hypothetical protein